MAENQPPITGEEMAALIQRTWNDIMADTADVPQGASFELTAPSTGQRFRVTVAEMPGRTDSMEPGLNEITKEASQ